MAGQDQFLPDPGANLMQLLELVSTGFANTLNQANRIGGHEVPAFDPNLQYQDVFETAGLPPWAAGALGLLTALLEPGPGELKTGARAVREGAQAVASRFPVPDPRTGNPLRMFRAEAPGGGPGPVAEGLGKTGSARYHGEPEYVRDFANRAGQIVREGTVMARPGAVLDTVSGQAFDQSDMMNRVFDAARKHIPTEQRELLERTIQEYNNGVIDMNDVLNHLRRTFGMGLGPLPREAGLDAIVQYADDAKDPRFVEAVTFTPDSWRDLNVYTGEEFLNLYPKTGGR